MVITLSMMLVISGCTATKSKFETSFNDKLLTPTDLANPIGSQTKGAITTAQNNIAKNPTAVIVTQPKKTTAQKMYLSSIVLLALEQNPTINIARWQAESADAKMQLAKTKYRPKIEYSFSIGPEAAYASASDDVISHIRSETSVTLSQLIYNFGKTSQEVDAAQNATISAQKRLAHKITTTLYDVSDIYLKVLEQDLLIGNSYENEKAHKKTYQLVKISEQGGNATIADVQKAFTRLEGARTQTIDMLSQRQRSASEFRRLTGVAPENLSIPKVKSNNAGLKLSDIQKYFDRHPFMQSLLIDIKSLKHQKTALERSYLPQLTLEGTAGTKDNVGSDGPMNADARIQLALRGVLFDGGNRKAKIAQIYAKIGEKTARFRKAQYDVENEINDAIRILETAKSKRTSIKKRIKASEDVVRLYTEQFKAGERGIFELLDAQQELFAARAEQISNRYDVLRANYSAQKLTGTLIPNLLGNEE